VLPDFAVKLWRKKVIRTSDKTKIMFLSNVFPLEILPKCLTVEATTTAD
jgi:hypothetical protein